MAGGSENPDSKRNFILQQGLDRPAQESCPVRFSALMFQPRLVGSFILLAVILQSPAIFLVLSGILWWNVLIPRLNLFDVIYNRTLANRREPPAWTLLRPLAGLPREWLDPSPWSSACCFFSNWGRLPSSCRSCFSRRLPHLFSAVLSGLVPVPSPSRKIRFRDRHASVETGTFPDPLNRRNHN